MRGRLTAILLLVAAQVQAEPQFARMYKGKYGYAPSCNACHKDGGGTPLNSYGDAFKKAKMTPAAFDTIAGADSDGDGAPNGDEAKAQANPGSPQSTPAKKGDWLNTANLIPREVQKLYPGVTSYKPVDAVLTKSEIDRAKAMGVSLAATDENTIYVPIKDGKPLGTALIAPAQHQGKVFFLLVGTDPKLKLSHVSALNTKQVPAAAKSDIYSSFTGKDAAQLAAPSDPASLDGAITDGVRRAGALLTVRLKGK
jgi:hypothetical protein